MTISKEEFTDVLRLFAAGVTLVTTRSSDRPHGMTVTAFSSISAEPPLVAVVIDRRHTMNGMLAEDDAAFAVSFLGEEHEELSNRFAFEKDEDRFARGAWETATTGSPVLSDALAWLDCTVAARHDAGSHTIYIGRVEQSRVPRPDGRPLVYWNRSYRQV